MLVDKVEGLDLGADDYIEKPFDLLELMSRVNAKLRRHKKIKRHLDFGNLILDQDKRECYFNHKLIDFWNRYVTTVFKRFITFFSILDIYDCEMPNLSATSFCVNSSLPKRP